MGVLIVFIDGLGLGASDAAKNPLMSCDDRGLLASSQLRTGMPKQGICLPADTCLGVGGLPQSATGQTSLFTGVNAPLLLGRHLQGFPNRELREVISEQSIFQKVLELGLEPTFANVYTQGFFERRPRWLSVTTVMCESAGVKLRTVQEMERRKGLFMDFTNGFLRSRGVPVPAVEPREAARILASLAEQYSLCLYEYFLTDLVGHRGSFEEAVELLRQLDSFLVELVEAVDLSRMSLVITSDHGNIEDMSTSSHTFNPVPVMLWGKVLSVFENWNGALDLTHISPRIIAFLAREAGKTSLDFSNHSPGPR